MRPPVPLTPPRPRRRRKPPLCFFHPTHPRSTPRSPSPPLNPSPSHASRGTAPHRGPRGSRRDRKHRRAPPPPRAARPAGPPTRLVRSCGAGYAAGAARWSATATRRAAPGRPPARLWKLRRLCMARSLGLGRAGVVECGRKQPGRTVGGAAAGTPLGWLVGSLAALLLQDVDVLHATTGARHRSLHCFGRVDREVIMPRCAAG